MFFFIFFLNMLIAAAPIIAQATAEYTLQQICYPAWQATNNMKCPLSYTCAPTFRTLWLVGNYPVAQTKGTEKCTAVQDYNELKYTDTKKQDQD